MSIVTDLEILKKLSLHIADENFIVKTAGYVECKNSLIKFSIHYGEDYSGGGHFIYLKNTDSTDKFYVIVNKDGIKNRNRMSVSDFFKSQIEIANETEEQSNSVKFIIASRIGSFELTDPKAVESTIEHLKYVMSKTENGDYYSLTVKCGSIEFKFEHKEFSELDICQFSHSLQTIKKCRKYEQ